MSVSDAVTWGLVSTIKAPVRDILNFAAYHIDLGAHRLFLYLDAESPTAYEALKAHPKVRVRQCDRAYWKKLNKWRPVKHQVRQCLNATHAYGRATDVDWLVHIDVDEFIFSDDDICDKLQEVPGDCSTARLRPMEALAGASDHYKAFIPGGPKRDDLVDRLYPEFGRYLRGGFLSHVAGKIFLRSGLPDIELRIHNAAQNGRVLDEKSELADVALCHRHVTSWEDWRAHFAYRHEKGAYRAELPPARGEETAHTTLHQMLAALLAEEGEDGLRRFFEETSMATPEHLAKLRAEGLLRHCALDLDAKRAKHFPEHAEIVA